jgi:pimeloyl-ACP methyl ester carboxylesterase
VPAPPAKEAIMTKSGSAVRTLAVVGATLTFTFSFSPSPSVSADTPPAYFVDVSKLPFNALPGTTTTRLFGVHGGAGYRIEVPDDWNGDLVLYAHGFRGGGLELTVDNPRIRQFLVSNGFAWAASSYSKNGYDVKEGVKDTHALTGLFNGLVGRPRRTYLIGHSMGGHITGVAIEQYPNAYDGAMPMCGVMGDSELFDYFLDFQLVAQALSGIQTEYPFPADYQTTTVPAIKAVLGPAYPVVLFPPGQSLRAVTEQVSGGIRPGFASAFTVWGNFLFGVGGGDGTLGVAPGRVVGNIDTVYQMDGNPALSADEAALNAMVRRISEDPQGRHPNGLGNIPGIQGRQTIPTVSLHTLGDLFVPFSMEQIYRRRAEANGASANLVQRAYRDLGHCGFAVVEEEEAFAGLVNWVETGAAPAGDDVLTPSVVAASTYGCQFTRGARPGFAACP